MYRLALCLAVVGTAVACAKAAGGGDAAVSVDQSAARRSSLPNGSEVGRGMQAPLSFCMVNREAEVVVGGQIEAWADDVIMDVSGYSPDQIYVPVTVRVTDVLRGQTRKGEVLTVYFWHGAKPTGETDYGSLKNGMAPQSDALFFIHDANGKFMIVDQGFFWQENAEYYNLLAGSHGRTMDAIQHEMVSTATASTCPEDSEPMPSHDAG